MARDQSNSDLRRNNRKLWLRAVHLSGRNFKLRVAAQKAIALIDAYEDADEIDVLLEITGLLHDALWPRREQELRDALEATRQRPSKGE